MSTNDLTLAKLRNQIHNCRICRLKSEPHNQIFFSCNDPRSVKVMVITEQPKDTKTTRASVSIMKRDLMKKTPQTATRDLIRRFLGKRFVSSVVKNTGKYYWSHHTKCSSLYREPRDRCMRIWTGTELSLFPNLRVILCFGSRAYRGIMNVLNQGEHEFRDYFWRELKILITGKGSIPKVKRWKVIALPHPSQANPLSMILQYLKPMVVEEIRKALI